MLTYPQVRMRRLRYHPQIRDLVRETHLTKQDLVLPLFIKEGIEAKLPIAAMPGLYQLSLQDLGKEIDEIVKAGVTSIILFGIPTHKDKQASEAYNANGIIQQAIRLIKKQAPQLLVMTDICLCEYFDHGHCGLVEHMGDQCEIANDATLDLIVKQAISHVQAGADIVAPSGMMDGMILALRQGLDQAGFINIPIMSYAAKYSSALYRPFRDAAESVPQFGDRRSYQMDPANSGQAIRETMLDVNEGADVLMVKPAGFYLDVIYRIKHAYPGIPLAAYQVGGEYAMIKAAVQNDWLDEKAIVLESLLAIKRAGADIIITYFAKDAANWLS